MCLSALTYGWQTFLYWNVLAFLVKSLLSLFDIFLDLVYCFGWCSHFHNTDSPSPRTWYVSALVSPLISFIQFLTVFCVQVFCLLGEVSVQFSHSVMSEFLQPHEPQHARPLCPSPTPRLFPNPCPLCRWCFPTISSSAVPFSSCPQSLPASGSFQMSQLFSLGGQTIGVSASTSVLPVNTQDWYPLGWTGWISLPSRDSQESSPTPQFKNINSSVLSFLYIPTLTSIHNHWKNHSLDWTDLCWQNNVSAF